MRARAGAIGFASSNPCTSSHSSLFRTQNHLSVSSFPLVRPRSSRQIIIPGRYADEDRYAFDDDEDGIDNGDDDDNGGGNQGWEDDAVDTDVLPTMLVYRGGELVHTWVRVDWEAKTGIEDLLRRQVCSFSSALCSFFILVESCADTILFPGQYQPSHQ